MIPAPRQTRAVQMVVCTVAALSLVVAGCGSGPGGSEGTALPGPEVAGTALLYGEGGQALSGNPAIISAAGKVLTRPAVTPASALLYDSAGALWVVKRSGSRQSGTGDGCEWWRVDPPRVVLTESQLRPLAAREGLAQEVARARGALCRPSLSSSGGLVATTASPTNEGDAFVIALPPGADSADEATLERAGVTTGSTPTEGGPGKAFPTWDGGTLRVSESAGASGASSVTLERADGSSTLLWGEGVGLNVRSAQISRDGKWLLAVAGPTCLQCQTDLYRTAIKQGPAGASPDGEPTVILRGVQSFSAAPPFDSQAALPVTGSPSSTSAAPGDGAAPRPLDLLASDVNLPVGYSDLGEPQSSDGLSPDFMIPGDTCTPETLTWDVVSSAEQVVEAPDGTTTSVLVMDASTRENAGRILEAIRSGGRACETDAAGHPELVAGIAAKIGWHSSAAVDGDYASVSTNLVQTPGANQMLTHGAQSYFVQGPYVVRVSATSMGISPVKVTDPLSLEPEMAEIISTVAAEQKRLIRAATGNRPRASAEAPTGSEKVRVGGGPMLHIRGTTADDENAAEAACLRTGAGHSSWKCAAWVLEAVGSARTRYPATAADWAASKP